MGQAMNDIGYGDYSWLDRPEILSVIFHPRRESVGIVRPVGAVDLSISVEDKIVIGGRFHMADKSFPNILFFHGNGEIASDYDDLGALYNRMGMNFLAVDYRGYGRSTGRPSVTAMMGDCHAVFEFTTDWLAKTGCTGGLVVMGRSLGSASALELAHFHKDRISGLIVESGFAYLGPLLAFLGVNTTGMGFTEEKGVGNLDKIRQWDKPLLVIHAEFDHIIPFSDGRALYEACPSPDKTFLMIASANHNDIFMRGTAPYMEAVKKLCDRSVG